jgi:DNA-binding CsgD family transcriptional regulator
MRASSHCHKGREAYARRAWDEAYRALTLADAAQPLGGEDLELLATSAYLSGRDSEFLKAYERAHQAHLGAGFATRAARCAFWLALALFLRGETGRATGWLGRARRLVERTDCAERGYLLLPVVEQQLATGDFDGAYRAASNAAALGERFAEPDLVACGRHLQGRSLLHQGRVATGLALLDEAMIAVSAGELSPVMTGLLYCSVIQACQHFYALSRAREWTAALAQWCEKQPEMVAFTGTCLVHRAEVLQMRGAWHEAIEEARRACKRFGQGTDPSPPGTAFYQEAEVHRLRGDFAAAEAAYRSASQKGHEPQPGLALLRLSQGRTGAAAAAIRRVMAVTTGRLQRTALLPAYVEIMLAAGEVPEARSASRELEETAQSIESDVLGAIAAQAKAAVDLAEGNAPSALGALRPALQIWQQAEAPYLAARVRVLLALACRALGDDEGAGLELDAARRVFAQLGAAPELARIDALARTAPRDSRGLTARELQVLRLIAAGKTNKGIAAELSLSEKTVDRHVSNIFNKLDVPSRAAATAYAYEHRLI